MIPFEPLRDLIAKSVADGNLQLAIEFLGELLKLEDSVDTRLRRAHLLLKTGCPDGAIAEVNEVIRRQPENVLALVLRGMAWKRKGIWEQGEADACAALALDATCADALLLRGFCCYKLGDQAAAVRDFTAHAKLPAEPGRDPADVHEFLELPTEASANALNNTADGIAAAQSKGNKKMATWWRPGPVAEGEDDEPVEQDEPIDGGSLPWPVKIEVNPAKLMGVRVKLRLHLEAEFTRPSEEGSTDSWDEL